MAAPSMSHAPEAQSELPGYEAATSSGPKRVKDMTPAERLESLREWAEEQKYVRPGQAGTLAPRGVGGMNALVYGGPVRYVEPAYQGYIAPPSYDTAQNAPTERKSGPLRRWWTRQKGKRATRSDSVQT